MAMKTKNKEVNIVRRTPFLGKKITPKNRFLVREQFYTVFLQKVLTDEVHKDMSHDDKVKAANFYAKLEVSREQKHYKAWLKGKRVYKFKGQTYPVLTEQVEDQSTYLSDIMDLEPFLEEE